MVYSVVNGDFLVNFAESQAAENVLKRALKDHQIKGFSNVLIAQKVEEGLSALIQTAGLGGLRFFLFYVFNLLFVNSDITRFCAGGQLTGSSKLKVVIAIFWRLSEQPQRGTIRCLSRRIFSCIRQKMTPSKEEPSTSGGSSTTEDF
jgi:hypothetical protein